MAYRSSSRPDCIFEIHQLWQSGFSRVYSNCCCSCSFEREIIRTGQSSHKMYSNNIVNFQESTIILNASTKKKSGNLLKAHVYVSVCAYTYVYAHTHIYCIHTQSHIYIFIYKLFPHQMQLVTFNKSQVTVGLLILPLVL